MTADPGAARAALLAAARETIASALEKAGIPWAALKGLDLSYRAYPRAADREMSDLDLLVDPTRLEEADAAFKAAGLTPLPSRATHHRRFLCRPVEGAPVELPVELHRELFERPHPFRVDSSALLAGRTAVPLPAGGTLPVLAPAHAWLHVAAHFAWSDAAAGPVERTIQDLLRLGQATALLPEALLAEGRSWGVLRPVAQVLRLVEEVLGPFQDPRLRAVVDSHRPAPRPTAVVFRRRIARARAHPGRPERRGSATLARALLAPRWRDGLAVVVAGLGRLARD